MWVWSNCILTLTSAYASIFCFTFCWSSTLTGRVKVARFADGEVSLQFLDSLRGKDVYIVQATSPPVNENLVELLLMISTCRRSSAKTITAVIPYYGYARQVCLFVCGDTSVFVIIDVHTSLIVLLL